MPITLNPAPNEDRTRAESRVECISIAGGMLLHILAAPQRRGIIATMAPGQLPDDVRCVGLTHDPITNTIRLYVHSATFQPVDQGTVPPERSLTYGSIYLPTTKAIEASADLMDGGLAAAMEWHGARLLELLDESGVLAE